MKIVKKFFIKKGLSQVIAILLIVLASIVAISILWVVISNLVSKQSEIAKTQATFFNEPLEIAGIKFDPGQEQIINLGIKKISGKIFAEKEEIESVPLEFDVVSVVDLSGSMRACLGVSQSCCINTLGGDHLGGNCYAIHSSKLSACTSQCGGSLVDGLTPAQDANKLLVEMLLEGEANNNQIGLSAYSTNVIPSYSSNLISDSIVLKGLIDSWESIGYTCICCGINDAKDKLSGSPENILKNIIVMSDGSANQECPQQGTTGDLNGNGASDDDGDDAIQSACDAYSAISNLTIYSVGLGGSVDQKTMELIAKSCGNGRGQNFSAQNVNDLISIYQTLANQMIQNYKSFSNLNYLKVIFYDDNLKSTFRNVDVPEPSEIKNYKFDLTSEGLGPIVRIEIYPVIRTSSGEEIIGPLADSWEKR